MGDRIAASGTLGSEAPCTRDMGLLASPVVFVNLAAGRCSDLVRLQVNMGEVSLRLRRGDCFFYCRHCCQWQASWGTLGMAWGHFLAEGFGQCFRVRI